MAEHNKLKSARNDNLDLLRVLACIAVVGLHTLQKDLSLLCSTVYYLCGFAVPLFFMSSGYVLFQRKEADWHYSGKKILSILKLVLLWNGLLLVFRAMVYTIQGKLSVGLLADSVREVFLGLLQKGVFWHFWYFGALMILYFLYPMLLKGSRKGNGLLICWLIFVGICVLIQTGSYLCHEPLQRHLRQTFRIWTWIQYFLFGGVIGRNEKNIHRWISRPGIAVLLLSILVAVQQNVFARAVLNNLYAEYFYDDLIMILWCGAIFVWGMSVQMPVRLRAGVQLLQGETLGVYLVHPLIRDLVRDHYTISSTAISFGFFAALVLFSFVLVFLMKRWRLGCLVKL